MRKYRRGRALVLQAVCYRGGDWCRPGPEVTRGGTDAVAVRNLVYPVGSLGPTFRLLSICAWHPEQACTHGLPAHTHSLTHTDRGVRVSHVRLSQFVLPTLQRCLLSLWQQGSRTAACPLRSGPFSSQNPNRKHWICLSSLCTPLWHSLQSQTMPHALTLDILDTELKLTVHKLEFKNCLPIYLPINYLSICLSIHHPFVYLS